MKLISSKMHGYLDYAVAIILIGLPWINGFNQNGPDTWVLVILGIGTILYSVMTDYELGLLRVFSMKTHLVLDTISGLLLIVSPWLFGFSDYVYMPHIILGAFELLVVLMTRNSYESKIQPERSSIVH
jgi:hypothetical protein